jgi:hypothetical protein
MTNLHTQFYMPSSKDALVIPVKMDAKEHFRTAAVLLFYVTQKLHL